MNRAKRIVLTIEHLISNKTKQHIVGGLLFSVSVFLGALATTVLTMKVEQAGDDLHIDYQDDTDEEECDEEDEDHEYY